MADSRQAWNDVPNHAVAHVVTVTGAHELWWRLNDRGKILARMSRDLARRERSRRMGSQAREEQGPRQQGREDPAPDHARHGHHRAGMTMHDTDIVILYVCVVALTEIGVSEIWQSWGRYERNDFAAWGLAFTIYDESELWFDWLTLQGLRRNLKAWKLNDDAPCYDDAP